MIKKKTFLFDHSIFKKIFVFDVLETKYGFMLMIFFSNDFYLNRSNSNLRRKNGKESEKSVKFFFSNFLLNLSPSCIKLNYNCIFISS